LVATDNGINNAGDDDLRTQLAAYELENRRLKREVTHLQQAIKREKTAYTTVLNQQKASTFIQRERERNLSLLLANSPNIIFFVGLTGRIEFCTEYFVKKAGYTESTDVLGRELSTVLAPFLDADTVEKLIEQIGLVLKSNEPVSFDMSLRFKENNGDKDFTGLLVPMTDAGKKSTGLMLLFHDITDLNRSRREALAASQAKSSFLSNMSHEIRTPMNAIKGLAELLALSELSGVQSNYVQNIVKSSNSLLSIINDVLDFSQINANKMELVEKPYLLEELITEVSSVVSLRATDKGLLLFMDIEPALPRSLIGDEVRVKQVIINILNNAIKYTPEGQVVFRLFGVESEDRFELVCEVEDTGIGIREEDIPYLFDAFSQADRSINHNIQGTGLGLSISDQLAKAMGGNITVKSDYGKGSVFTVHITQGIEDRAPLAAVENPAEKNVLLMEREETIMNAAHMLDELGIGHTEVTSMANLGNLPGNDYTHCIYDSSFSENSIRALREKLPHCVFIALKDMRYAVGKVEPHDDVLFIPMQVTELAKTLTRVPGQVSNEISSGKSIDNFVLSDAEFLLVDDNEINLLVGEELLRAYNAEVTCADSGEKALELCAEKKYDMIFMDHMMPGMDGVETTKAIRSSDTLNTTTPIIALTANVVNDMASYYLQNGMDDFIGKPIELADLSRILLQWLPSTKIETLDTSFPT